MVGRDGAPFASAIGPPITPDTSLADSSSCDIVIVTDWRRRASPPTASPTWSATTSGLFPPAVQAPHGRHAGALPAALPHGVLTHRTPSRRVAESAWPVP
ncbi:hypothetical protein [Mesorhizobium sp. L-8-3]|uniref:hypothetical protein n=1 Tax=Mesorhizobium sp. L-8-3 TaxID=2744522 RepID=UPI00192737C7|nr:hypothetical protein [Mesorhizobium sp. L-8-3]